MNATLWEKVAALAATQYGLVSWPQLERLGVTAQQRRWLLDRGDFVATEEWEVYRTTAAPTSAEQRVLAAVLAAGDGAVASHTTAAAIEGVHGYRLGWLPIHVTVEHDRRPESPKCILHYSRAMPSHHLSIVRGIPVTSVARTLFDLGRVRKPHQVERALDDALVAKLVTLAECERVLLDLAGPGRSGTRLMRELLDERGDGFVVTRSRLERAFLKLVRDYDLPPPRREIDLGTDEEWNGRVEFVFDPGVLVEIDGRRWHTALLDMERDDDRDAVFRGEGFGVLRFRYRILRDRPAIVAERIRRNIAAAQRRQAA